MYKRVTHRNGVAPLPRNCLFPECRTSEILTSSLGFESLFGTYYHSKEERPDGEKMVKNRLEEPEFRLLASVYAELGPDAVGARLRTHRCRSTLNISGSEVDTRASPIL
jgi:hypothetical protein